MIRYLAIYILVILSSKVGAFDVRNIEVKCAYKNGCTQFEDEVRSIIGEEIESVELRERLKLLLFNKTLKKLSYEYNPLLKKLSVRVTQKKVISSLSINLDADVNLSVLKKEIPFKEGDIYNERDKNTIAKMIKKHLDERGYGNSKVSFVIRSYDNLVDIGIKISAGQAIVIRRVNIKVDRIEPAIRKYINDSFNKFVGKPWNKVRFDKRTDEMSKELSSQGYVESEILVKSKEGKAKEDVLIDILVKLGKKKHFYFFGNKSFNRQELMEKIHLAVKNMLGKFSVPEIIKAIVVSYEEIGIYETTVKVRVEKGKSQVGVKFINYYCEIQEGEKYQVSKIQYRGNLQLDNQTLNDWYNDNASILASRGFFDKKYVNRFASIIKNEYLKRGFVFIDVEEPQVVIEGNEVSILYEIREGQECIVREILLNNVDMKLMAEMKAVMVNQVGKAFNSIALSQDLREIIIRARNEGYYFAEIVNQDKLSIVKFTSDYSEVTIDIDLRLDKKTILDNVIVSGNVKTRDIVIKREVNLNRNNVLTYKDLSEIQSRLTSLGLFSTVEITPYVTNRESDDEYFLVNLLIRVQEIKFGAFEVAPGFRSDIGWKVSLGLNYNNLGGMNRLIGLRLQSNLRTNLDELDSRRRLEGKDLLEFSARLKLAEPNLLGSGLGSSVSLSASRKRFYGYDANIGRLSSVISKSYDHFSMAITYRFENINQFDASESKDHGTFTIGGITPSISMDFREPRVNPSRGVYMGLSCEFANSFWGSQDDDKLEINFIRLVSRNKLYFPMGKWIGAVSFSMGYERNLAQDGYIPGIKVFRLTGVDIVRGFEDEEINRLSTGEDISERTIDNTAYFMTLKVEPRYKLSDSTVVGLFYDMGRVYVDKFDPSSVRASFGGSFKFLTPVGSLNFDYGIKFKRSVYATGHKEAFGRFHLLIGYF